MKKKHTTTIIMFFGKTENGKLSPKKITMISNGKKGSAVTTGRHVYIPFRRWFKKPKLAKLKHKINV